MIGIVATMLGNILAARLLTPAEFGWYLIFATIIAIGAILGMAGLNEAGLRLVAECLGQGNASRARSYARASLKIVGASSLIVAGAIGLALCFIFPASRQPLLAAALIAIGLVFMASQQLAAELARGFGELRIASLFSGGQSGGSLTNLLFFIALAAVWISGVRPSALFVTGLLVGAVAVTCPLSFAGLWQAMRVAPQPEADLHPEPSAPRLTELFSISIFLLANQALAFVSQQADLWIGGAVLPDEQVGLFGAAKRSVLVVAMPVQMAMFTIVASIPRLHVQSRASELEALVRGAATAAAVPALAAAAIIVAFPALFLSLLLGDAYAGGSTPLLVLVAGHLVLVLSGNPQHLLIMTGRHRVVLAVNCLSALVLVVAGVLLARAFGMVGLAAASAISLAVFNGLLWWIAHRELKVWTHVGWPQPQPGTCGPSAEGAENLVGAAKSCYTDAPAG
jgi:O-antigen/teichoic acid export membrane protein